MNAKLELQTVPDVVNRNAEPSDDTPEVYRDVYELMRIAAGPWDYADDSLVFPLPKLPAKTPSLPHP